MFETVDRHGMRKKSASIRGATRKRSGPMPIASIASTSSDTFIVPNSAVNAAPIRAASMMPVIKRTKFARESDCDQTGNKPFGPEALQLITGQKRHGQAEEKRNQPHQWHRIDPSPLRVTEKAGRAKRHTPPPDSLECLLKRMRDKPEHASYFAQKIAADLTDFLSNHNGQVIVCHVQGGKLPHFMMRKRTK